MSLIERWTNFKLWWKYPFIRPRTLTHDKYCSEFFKYTLLHLMPKGWTKAFGNKFCEDLNDALMCCNKSIRKTFRIYDMKEKHGRLQVSCNWYTPEINEVLYKYEKLSAKTCVACGNKAYWLTKGYIVPMCNHCKREYKNKYKFTPMYKKYRRKKR